MIDAVQITNANSSDEFRDTNSVSITLPPNVFSFNSSEANVDVIFEVYNSSKLFPLVSLSEGKPTFAVGSNIVGATIIEQEIANLTDNVIITLKLVDTVSTR